MPKYRKKPVVIEAEHWDGSYEEASRIGAWANGNLLDRESVFLFKDDVFSVSTLEGLMTISPGDWVIKGVHGEFYPCKPDIFEATYDPVED